MFKFCDGKPYYTKEAELIAIVSDDQDNGRYTETLYRGSPELFFIHKERKEEASELRTLTRPEAIGWLLENEKTEELAKYFPETLSKKPTVRICGGRRYDTSEAELIAITSNGEKTDQTGWTETLYRKECGVFFLHCEGGKSTIYAKVTGDDRTEPGEEIKPISDEEALAWLKKYNKTNEIERLFPETIGKDAICKCCNGRIPDVLQVTITIEQKMFERKDIF